MLNGIMKLLPAGVRSRLLTSLKKQLKEKFERDARLVTTIDFEPRHLAHCKVLVDRFELLKLMPKGAVVAEIGVDQGAFSERILQDCSPAKLHLVDIWGTERYGAEKKRKVEQRFAQEISSDKVEINIGLSLTVVGQFKDNYFDWIYIDTDHSYKTTLQELIKYAPKIKENGIMAGHDYIAGYWNGMVRYGVVEAVHEFCFKYNWELIYLSTEITDHPSFAIRRIPR